MSTIEDELRAVLDGFSEHGAPAVDRTAAVTAKIQHHQRVRAAGLAAALVIAIAVAGGVLSTGWLNPARHPAPPAGPVYEPEPKPGYLANYADGGKLVTSGTAIMPATTTITLTFTPENWDFMIGEACVGPDRLWDSVFINGSPMTSGQCAPGPGGRSVDMGGDWDAHETFWEALGVHLGEPVTVTARIGTPQVHDPSTVTPTSDAGLASVGVYTPVPWDEYHFPAKPAHPGTLGGVEVHLSASYSAVTTANPAMTMKLPAQIEVTATTIAPGSISVYINGVKIDECDTWSYQEACSGAIQDVGKGRLAGFTVGETVTVTAQVTRLPPDTWEVTLGGSS